MAPVEVFGMTLPTRVVIPAVYVTLIVFGWTVKKVLFAWLRHLTSRTETTIDDVIIEAANWPITVMIFVWSLAATLKLMGAAISPHWSHEALVFSKLATLVAIILFVDRLLIKSFEAGTKKFEVLRSSHAFGGVLVHGTVFVLGGLMLLDSVGISITPIIASLGLGSLAVALALQPTLENVFSGFQLIVDQPIRIGNLIKLESGEEGFVHQIGWRTTWIRQGVNNMIILPNKQLVNARVLNYDYPSPDMIFTISMGVHYASDLAKVERLAVEVAADVLKRVPGGVTDFAPLVRFNKFSASSIDFAVVLRAKSYGDTGLLTHEFIKAVTARFSAENVVMPYPVVALDTAQQSARFTPN